MNSFCELITAVICAVTNEANIEKSKISNANFELAVYYPVATDTKLLQ